MKTPKNDIEEIVQAQDDTFKMPRGEITWMRCINKDGESFIITSKEHDRSMYFLYRIQDRKLTKISKNKNPDGFDKIIFEERI